jgi:hypothetical protein
MRGCVLEAIEEVEVDLRQQKNDQLVLVLIAGHLEDERVGS